MIGEQMSLWLQHLLVLLLVAACAAVVLRGAVRTLWGKASALGKCCARGCASPGEATPKAAGERVVFLPADALRARARERGRTRPH